MPASRSSRWGRPSPPSAPDADPGDADRASCTRASGYDYPHLRTWLRRRRITPRIARRGIESNIRLGRHRWVIERSLAWLTGYRRLTLLSEAPPPVVHRIPAPGRRAHLLQEARHMRQALNRVLPGVSKGGEHRPGAVGTV